MADSERSGILAGSPGRPQTELNTAEHIRKRGMKMFVKFDIDGVQFINLDFIEHIEVYDYNRKLKEIYGDVSDSDKERVVKCGDIDCYTKTPDCTDDNYRSEEYKIFDHLCGPNVYEAANALFEAMQNGDKVFDISKYYSDHDYTCCDEEGE